MSYQEAMELSYFGAKVLHPRTITPIAQFQIPCLIKNTGNPQAPGTLIGASRDEDELPVKGISNLNNMAMFSVSGPGMKGMVGMAARVFAAMSRARIRPVDNTTVLHCVSRFFFYFTLLYFRGADYAIIFRIQYQFLRSAKRLCAS